MAKKISIPLELKYDFAMRGYASFIAGILHAIREKYGSAEALEMYERALTIGDRIKNLIDTLLTIFKIEGNDAEAIAKWIDIWNELTGIECTWLERSKTINRRKVTKCPWVTAPRDLSEWFLPFFSIVTKTINPKATLERPKSMCAGDSYCEYVWKLEESTQLKGEEEPMAKKLETPCATPKRGLSWRLKSDFAIRNFTDFTHRGLMYAIREKYGAAATLEIWEKYLKKGVKNLTNTIRTIFKIEGNDLEALAKWWTIWQEFCGHEVTILERSKTILRTKFTKCPWKTEHKDISDWALPFCNIVNKTINPKATVERPKAMCAGDPYCEYVWKLEE